MTLAVVSFDPHGPTAASMRYCGPSRWSASTMHGFPAIHGVSRVTAGADLRTLPVEQREWTSAQASWIALTAATNLHDEVSVRADRSSTMSCRKKLYDVLSVRTRSM